MLAHDNRYIISAVVRETGESFRYLDNRRRGKLDCRIVTPRAR